MSRFIAGYKYEFYEETKELFILEIDAKRERERGMQLKYVLLLLFI